MPFDPKIALEGSAGPVLPNPLEFFSNMQGIQQKQHQNLLFQQQNDARVAAGEAYKRATGPDGRVNEPQLMELLKTLPGGQFALPEALAAAQKREQEFQAIQEKNLVLGRQRIGMFADALSGLMVKGDSVDSADVHRVVSKLAVQIGDPELVKTMFLGLKDMPKSGKELQDWIKAQNVQLLSAAEKIGLQSGTLVPVPAGGRTDLTQQDRLAGTVRKIGEVVNTPTPAERGALVEGQDPNTGAKTLQERQGVAPMPDGAGNIVSAPNAASRPVVMGPSVEKAEELKKTSEGYNKTLDEIAAQMQGAQQNLREIEKMRELVEQINPGITAEARMNLGRIAGEFGLSPEVQRFITGGSDPQAVAAAEAFMKKSWSQSMASLKSMTPSGTQWTGQEVFSNYANNPNLKMTPQAIKDLFDFETQKYEFLKEAQKYKSEWRTYNPDKPLRQMEVDWAKHAEQKGWVKPIFSGRGEDTTGFFNAPMIRDAQIPVDISIIHLSKIPRGAKREFTLGDGQTVTIRRLPNSNTYQMVK